jgi:hypothetical protein
MDRSPELYNVLILFLVFSDNPVERELSECVDYHRIMMDCYCC